VADAWHEDAIDIIHEKLDELLGTPMPYVGGRKEREHHACYPLVVWSPAPNGGKTVPTKTAGGNPAPIGLDTCQYLVTLWQSNKANCRATLHNLIVAARASSAKSSVRIGTKYDFPRDAHADAGVVMVATCEIDIVVTDMVSELVPGDELEVQGGIVEEHSDGSTELVATDIIEPPEP